ncbi:MAG: hypothetical protein EXS49_00940 [Candidatus Pacebacteria bacterium]|nr:hypothetical protein [Candidatus Paceibacterota bacterium]
MAFAMAICSLFSGCVSPVKEEIKPIEVQGIERRIEMNVVENDDTDLEKMRSSIAEMERIIAGLDKLNNGIEQLTAEMVSAK